jgi:hypothetical protein
MPKTKPPPTTRWRGIVVAILCGLLSLTTSSSADSAWVLWLGTGTTYTPFGAYGGTTSEKDCKEAANQLMADMKKDPKQLGEFLKSSSRYLCLPETVDPRGPKGK